MPTLDMISRRILATMATMMMTMTMKMILTMKKIIKKVMTMTATVTKVIVSQELAVMKTVKQKRRTMFLQTMSFLPLWLTHYGVHLKTKQIGCLYFH